VGGPVDLRDWLPPPRTQNQDESCTSFAGQELVASQVKRKTGQALQFSSEFVWTSERLAEGTFGQNVGCSIADDMSVLTSDGDCLLATMPDALGDYSDSIPPAAVTEAAKFKLTNPAMVDYDNTSQVNQALTVGQPILLGIDVYQSLFASVGRDGLLNAPADSGAFVGGHAILEVGWRSDGRRIWWFGSWPGFGDGCSVYVDPEYAQELVNSSLTAGPPA
jgi:hypothetical protein